MSSTLIFGIVALVAAAVLIKQSHGKRSTNADGRTWLLWGWAARIPAILGVATLIWAVVDALRIDDPTFALVILSMFGLVAVPYLAHVMIWGVAYGPDGLECRSAWRRTRRFPWSSVTGVSFSNGWKHWVISMVDGDTVRVNELVPGSDDLVAELRRRGFAVPIRPELGNS